MGMALAQCICSGIWPSQAMNTMSYIGSPQPGKECYSLVRTKDSGVGKYIVLVWSNGDQNEGADHLLRHLRQLDETVDW